MQITKHQLGIVEPNTSSAMFMMFDIANEDMLGFGLKILQRFVDGKNVVAGLGNNLMKHFPMVTEYKRETFNSEFMSDSDGHDLVIWIKNDDRGNIFHQARDLREYLKDFFEFKQAVSSYSYQKKFDLSGFEDGIENPVDKEIEHVVIIPDGELEGSSFWVLQQWLHDFAWLNNNSQAAKEACIGRSLDDSSFINNPSKSAHINKSAAENFTPHATLLRKSMPWSDDGLNGGLMFSCFATSFRSFNLQMASMLGIDDGVLDGLFKFSKILNTSYLWCPPFKKGRLDISLFDKK